MSYIEAVIFGIVQGITEFIPISSTAHLVITELLLGYHFPGLAFEIFLHVASVFAVMIFFRKELLKVIKGFFSYLATRNSKHRVQFLFGIYILAATTITGVLGVMLTGFVHDSMKTPPFIAAALTATGIFLIIIERIHKYGRRTEKNMNLLDSIFVGLGQTLAVLPGISRSGATLVTALGVGLSRETAVRYSFLLAIPVILGSSVLAFNEISNSFWADIGTGPLIVSFTSSFLFSIISIAWLINFLKTSRLIYFALYCFILALLVYVFLDHNFIIGI